MVLIRRVLGVALFVGLMVVGWNFASTNGVPVSVHYLLGETEPRPIWLVVLLAWTLGLLVAGAYLGFVLVRDRLELRRLRKAVHGLENELRDFRNKAIEVELPGPPTDVRAEPGPAKLGARGGR